MTSEQVFSNPSTLVAILVAARRAGDKSLERQIRRQLADEHGLRVSFAANELRREQERGCQ